MKIWIPLSLMTVLIACHDANTPKVEENATLENQHEHKTANANEFMHSSSVEELIQRFESPERDEYQQPEKVIEYLGEIEGKRIMDIGAGSGYFSVKLAKAGAHVIAADVDDAFLKHIDERVKASEIQNIELRKLPYDSPALKEGEVDMVFMVNTYHHIENRVAYFEKVKKGIGIEGSLVIVDFFKKELPVGPPLGHKVAKEKVMAELKDAGFSQIELETELLPYQYLVVAK